MANAKNAAAANNAANECVIAIQQLIQVDKEGKEKAHYANMVASPFNVGTLTNASNLATRQLLSMIKNKIANHLRTYPLLKEGVVSITFSEPWRGIDALNFRVKFTTGFDLLADISKAMVELLQGGEDEFSQIDLALGLVDQTSDVVAEIMELWKGLDSGDANGNMKAIDHTRKAIKTTQKGHLAAHKARIDEMLIAAGHKSMAQLAQERKEQKLLANM